MKLEERTTLFGYNIIALCKKLKVDFISKPLINQLVRSGTSVGANYMEASQACSKRDFVNKIRICQKEASETKYWLRMVSACQPVFKNNCYILFKESHELMLIFGKISGKLKK